MTATIQPQHSPDGWQASLTLGFRRRTDKTVLAQREQRGPLAVQRPFYPEQDVCHLYILHPPGGVVGGDQLRITTRVEEHASALITTPGATKFYRSAGQQARQTQHLSVADNASLEWLPQENIFFPGSNSRLDSEIHLNGNARFIGWEMQCLGRPANQERFESGNVRFSLKLFRDDEPLLLERLIACADNLDELSGLCGQPVVATLLATRANQTLLESLQSDPGELPGAFTGMSCIDDLLICRYLGNSTDQARRWMVALWEQIRPVVLLRQPCPPRIWST